MTDPIERQDAIDAVKFGITYAKAFDVNTGESKELFKEGNDALKKAVERLKELPSAQPELPKQFMSDDCISRSELYKKVCEAEKLARERVLDTPSDSPFPNKLNPAYTRYSAQLDERTQFKHMIADARSVQPEIIRCKDCIKRDYCRTTNIWAVPPDDDWYCGDAERREEP